MADSETVRPSPAEPPSSASRPGSDSGGAPGIPAAEKPGKDEREDDEREDDARETKRRRNCPKALDKVQELARTDRRHQSHCSSSFTFDTKFNACSPEFTPKFGSFNFCGEVREERERARQDEEEEEEEEEEEADEDASNPSVTNGIAKPLEGE